MRSVFLHNSAGKIVGVGVSLIESIWKANRFFFIKVDADKWRSQVLFQKEQVSGRRR